jgi:acyl-CoA reductase-like NAD-dependent aldehyde dehydrogenase
MVNITDSVEVTPAPSVPAGRLVIDGELRQAHSGQQFDVYYPGTGQVLTTCAEGDEQDIDDAVSAAQKALPRWSSMSPSERGLRLKKFANLIDEHSDELAQLTTLEMGKPIREAATIDAPQTAVVFRYFGEWCNKVYGDTCPVDPAFVNYTMKEPLGVVAAITAWNYPILTAGWKAAPALAMGNTVIVKPAEQSPLSAVRLAQIALEADIPPGVFNVVPGFGPTAGAALSSHMGVDKIAFTGEHRTAQHIVRASATNLKKISLECGGKSPHIIFEDADLDGAARAAFQGIFSNQGQVCNAGSRVFVHHSVHDAFLEKLIKRAERLRLGDPMNRRTRSGPVVSAEHKAKIQSYIDTGISEASRAFGSTPDPFTTLDGYFVQPTIFTDVTNEMRIAREEIFGPVLSVIRFESDKELIQQANDTIYGLAAGIWTQDIRRAHRVARAIQAGIVWINCYDVHDVSSPFGGFKVSGIGKELGKHALALYTQTKSIWVHIGR